MHGLSCEFCWILISILGLVTLVWSATFWISLIDLCATDSLWTSREFLDGDKQVLLWGAHSRCSRIHQISQCAMGMRFMVLIVSSFRVRAASLCRSALSQLLHKRKNKNNAPHLIYEQSEVKLWLVSASLRPTRLGMPTVASLRSMESHFYKFNKHSCLYPVKSCCRQLYDYVLPGGCLKDVYLIFFLILWWLILVQIVNRLYFRLEIRRSFQHLFNTMGRVILSTTGCWGLFTWCSSLIWTYFSNDLVPLRLGFQGVIF